MEEVRKKRYRRKGDDGPATVGSDNVMAVNLIYKTNIWMGDGRGEGGRIFLEDGTTGDSYRGVFQ